MDASSSEEDSLMTMMSFMNLLTHQPRSEGRIRIVADLQHNHLNTSSPNGDLDVMLMCLF